MLSANRRHVLEPTTFCPLFKRNSTWKSYDCCHSALLEVVFGFRPWNGSWQHFSCGPKQLVVPRHASTDESLHAFVWKWGMTQLYPVMVVSTGKMMVCRWFLGEPLFSWVRQSQLGMFRGVMAGFRVACHCDNILKRSKHQTIKAGIKGFPTVWVKEWWLIIINHPPDHHK